jgi:hypothetical protein
MSAPHPPRLTGCCPGCRRPIPCGCHLRIGRRLSWHYRVLPAAAWAIGSSNATAVTPPPFVGAGTSVSAVAVSSLNPRAASFLPSSTLSRASCGELPHWLLFSPSSSEGRSPESNRLLGASLAPSFAEVVGRKGKATMVDLEAGSHRTSQPSVGMPVQAGVVKQITCIRICRLAP